MSTRNISYFVAGNKFYEVTSGGAAIQRGGTLTTNDGRVSMVGNDSDQLGVFDGTKGYIYDPEVKTLTEIVDVDFVGTDMAVHQDSYFITVRA